jgi:thiol-disulfide isomerase/thioredoxin
MRILLLVAFLSLPLLAEEPNGIAEFNALNKELSQASTKFYKDYREAKKKDASVAYDFSKHPNHAFAPRFEEFADKWKGTPGAVRALNSLMRIAPQKKRKAVLERLLDDDHIGLKDIANALFNIRYATWADRPAALKRIIEKSLHRDVRGQAMLQLAWIQKYTQPKHALEVLARLKQEYGDVSYRGQTLSVQADREIFEITRLSVGKEAPDIVGEDIGGVAMKLSDYRGRVVFLDFWGDW